ncbi:hypothetical protein C7H62_2652 [Mesoflavibacter sp. HG96]|uniref:Metal-dependent hydrolase n=1 Tax=Mesoflavibacter profundi TaxID=2708110 RepID=A0ABT4RYA6_9FLAO|nr:MULTISPECIES: metal-dependent hydrolase [Mesoflavibacter]MDA0176802.1 metal-dependent hydrolase [Mesoflavibacter profundi]QIJ90460.1 hypothetical protein C7H62_2652 [Mesoflavibacter sp. HG96]QIJ93188.1 hypothetical protein C7H56_2652 [Mesoflavibacter sp. HG37]
MDSLTQIVLGAACGELTLGRKIGNKAMLFGAIGGTIPDLDVFIGKLLFNNEIDITAFHRGFMHSFLFAFLFTPIIALVVYKFYNTYKRKHQTNYKDWLLLFFFSILTHPILDSFTPYGTQLFTPISNYRVAFNTIAVVDPIYTIPFLICLIIVMFYKRNHPKRVKFTKIGLFLSSAYLIITCVNKLYVNSVFTSTLEQKQINVLRYQSQPTLFNNLLWYAVAETNTDYYAGYYSILDSKTTFSNWHKIEKSTAGINLLNRDITTLKWFSNNYFKIEKSKKDNSYIYTDLRYPFIDPENKNSALFKFKLYKDGARWNIKQDFDRLPNQDQTNAFFERIKGN